jgi:hypothetical protein
MSDKKLRRGVADGVLEGCMQIVKHKLFKPDIDLLVKYNSQRKQWFFS